MFVIHSRRKNEQTKYASFIGRCIVEMHGRETDHTSWSSYTDNICQFQLTDTNDIKQPGKASSRAHHRVQKSFDQVFKKEQTWPVKIQEVLAQYDINTIEPIIKFTYVAASRKHTTFHGLWHFKTVTGINNLSQKHCILHENVFQRLW